jgi:hypothetical protein
MSAELIILCGTCRRPVGPGAGCLWVGFTEISDARGARTRWDEDRAASFVTLEEMTAVLAATVTWKIHHDGCTAGPDDGYWIDVEQITTWAQLAWWTAHLMAKNWLELTDWDQLLREVAGEGGPSPRITVRMRSAA